MSQVKIYFLNLVIDLKIDDIENRNPFFAEKNDIKTYFVKAMTKIHFFVLLNSDDFISNTVADPERVQGVRLNLLSPPPPPFLNIL